MTVAAETEVVYCCKHPGCSRIYVSTDGVRKHCRKHHPRWLAELDEHAKEERTHHRSELYCTQRNMTRADLDALVALEPRKRLRRPAPHDEDSVASFKKPSHCGSRGPLLVSVSASASLYATPRVHPAEPSCTNVSPALTEDGDDEISPSAGTPTRPNKYSGHWDSAPMLHTDGEAPGEAPGEDEDAPRFFSLCMPPLKRGASLVEFPEQTMPRNESSECLRGTQVDAFLEVIWA